jgi:GDSL-like lipase/acylhydrolase family protein
VTADASAARTSLLAAAALVAMSFVVTLLLGEIAIRIVHPSASLWRFPNYIEQVTRPDPGQPAELLRYDSELGWEPRPGASGILMHQPVSFSENGLRNQNKTLALDDRPPILAVGDSYTVGYAVKDDETWPANLERRLQRRVLNGGVQGYALDQIVLRADKLADSLHPQTIILAFIADDIGRTGLSVKDSTYKPYFVVKGDGLELRNVPVPPTRSGGPHTWPRRLLGYSYLLEFVMHRIGAREFWYGAQVSTDEDAPTISCRLMARFAGSVRRHSAHGLVVALPQYNDWEDAKAFAADRKRTSMVLECAHQQGLQTLDTYGGFAAISKDPRVLYVDWHLNAAGNGIAAGLIALAMPSTP